MSDSVSFPPEGEKENYEHHAESVLYTFQVHVVGIRCCCCCHSDINTRSSNSNFASLFFNPDPLLCKLVLCTFFSHAHTRFRPWVISTRFPLEGSRRRGRDVVWRYECRRSRWWLWWLVAACVPNGVRGQPRRRGERGALLVNDDLPIFPPHTILPYGG